METTKNQLALNKLAVGSRLIVRSKKDWRFAAVARVSAERITITVCSPSGRTYRLWRRHDVEIILEGSIPVLPYDTEDTWRENFCDYDNRW